MYGSANGAQWLALLLLALTLPAFVEADDRVAGASFHSGDFRSAEHCRECHPRQYLEWRGSTHAYAMVDPVFIACHRLAVEETGGEIGTECLECHSPIGVRSGELQPDFDGDALTRQTREGITCEVCHRSEPARPGSGRANADFEMTPGEVRFGNLYKPATNVFHQSSSSPFLRQSRSCGTCHDVAHRGRLVEKSFKEWQESEFSGPERVQECQDCHMPRYSGQAATNGPFREELRRHNFPGVALPLTPFPNRGYQKEEIREFLRRSARVSVEVPDVAEAGGTLSITVSVKNSGTGHNLPAASMRQMWLEVTVLDSSGCVLYRSGHLDDRGDLLDGHSELQPYGDPDLAQFSDAHVDDEGREVPYWRATHLREGSLKPLETRHATYRLPIPSSLAGTSVHLTVRLLLRPHAPYSLRRLGLSELLPSLPTWEMDAFSGALRVVRDVPRRTEYRLPGDFPDLQAAIDGLEDGDTVRVAPGEYVLSSPLDFRGKQVRLTGLRGPDHTLIRLRSDAPVPAEQGSVVVFRRGEGRGARIDGFTITGGTGTLADGARRGGGVYVERSSPVISGNRIVWNTAAGGEGGGIYSDRGDPVIADNEIFACRADRGGGLALHAPRRGDVVLRDNSLQGNTAGQGGGIWVHGGAGVLLERCVVAGNEARHEGGGLFVSGAARIHLDHVTFVHNRADHGGAVWSEGASPAASSSLFWSNEPFESSMEIRYSIVDAGRPAGPTNLDAFPLFVDPTTPWLPQPRTPPRPGSSTRGPATTPAPPMLGGNYQLLPGSPAIDAGDPRAVADPDDTRTDIGALYYEQPLRGFVRGDVDGSGGVDWGDVAGMLGHLLLGPELPCLDAGDVDDDGGVRLLDAVLLTWFLCTGRCEPAAPFPDCGLDPTFGEGLSCQVGSAACAEPTVRGDSRQTPEETDERE